ncbi:Trm112 family protein [Dactylosporangium sp. NPDC000555]|uniref:Trm112 family protein n=1 Tax=Dactylosporangium sp. NPDC000555 TaxID=3154260 RepID=UPI00332D2467
MSVDPALLSILRCPDEHHAELALDAEEQTLTCTECGRIFEIRDGIPVLLLDEARTPAPGSAAAAPAPDADAVGGEGDAE